MGTQSATSRGGSWHRPLAGQVAAALLAALVAAAASRAEPLLPQHYSRAGAGVAVLAKGVVWADDYRVLYQGFWSSSKVLGGVGETDPFLSSSARAVVLAGRGSREALFSAALPPGRFGPIGQIWAAQRGAGCEWLPSEEAARGGFVVVGEELVDGATCAEEVTFQEQAPRQPLFARDLRGGEWHVLRWLKGRASPILAAEGDLLAVGVPSSAQRMRVLIFELPSTAPSAQFDAPAGYLGFASPVRLVISVLLPLRSREPKGVSFSEAIKRRIQRRYRTELYSLDGRRLAGLGTFGDPPLVSHMHLLSVDGGEDESRLVVRSIPGGPSRPLVGFSEPVRTLAGFAFRWPGVAVVESTRVPRQQAEVTCTSGEYKPPGPRSLAILDLARAEPFLPAPPPAHLAPPPGKCPVQVVADGEKRETR